MARIRSVKPEFWTSPQIVACCRDARLMFIGIWNFADDSGVVNYNPLQLKMQIFPGDMVDPATIDDWLVELHQSGLISFFDNNGRRYLRITGFTRHQVIKNPSVRMPQLSDPDSEQVDNPFLTQSSPSPTPALPEGSDKANPTLPPGEGKGKGKGKGEGIYKEKECSERFGEVLLKNGSNFVIDGEMLADLKKTFPEIDVENQLLKLINWNRTNKLKRKTKAGMPKHIHSWLTSAANDKTASPGNDRSSTSPTRRLDDQHYGVGGAL